MRVLRGRGSTLETDRAASDRLLEIADTGESAVRVWVPHRQVAFGRRDRRLDGYERARTAASERGFDPVERSVGGRAVAYDGAAVLAFARAEPIDDFRRGTEARYERLTGDVESALLSLGASIDRGEPDDSFCPGTHSLRVGPGGGKLAGIAQRVRSDAAVVSGVLIVEDTDVLRSVLEAVYDALGVSFDPGSVGSVVAGGGPSAVESVRSSIESALVGEAPPTIERVAE